jgi:N-acetylglucosaminyl-diphospho-decaprenol L-rhamnosyltransferase
MPSETQRTTFSLIILSYNSGAYIERCIGAAMGLGADELILADNGSASIDLDGLRAKYPLVKIIDNGENLGFAAGNNRAAAQAAGDWLGFINPDAFAEPGWLEAMRAAIQNHPDTAMFTALQIEDNDPSKLDGLGDSLTFFGFPYRSGYGQPIPEKVQARETFSPCGAAFVIRADLYGQLGGFDERFFCYCEDADLGFRARLLGHICRLVPEARIRHIGSAASGVRSDFALYHGYRNRIWLYAKTMPLSLLLLTLPVHAVVTCLGAVKDTLKGKGGLVWRALADAFAGMGPILRDRKKIQATRRIGALRLAKVLTWNPLTIARRG